MSEFEKSVRLFRERYINGRHRQDSDPPAGFRAGAGTGSGAGAGAGTGSGAGTRLTSQVNLTAAMNYIRNVCLPRQKRCQAQVNLYQQALVSFRSQAGTPPPAGTVPAPGYMAQAMQARSFAFWDETACSPHQDGWDLVLDGGSRLPFPAAVAVDPGPSYSGAMQIRLVSAARGSGKSNLMHNFVQGLVQLPPCPCPTCQPGAQPSLSGAGYTSGGKLTAGAIQFQNPGGPGGGCPKCRHSACRCQPAARPRFSNKGMPGFDGRTLADLEAGLEAGELPDVFGVLRGYRWWSMTAPDLSKSPAHADQDWERSPLRGMRDVWQDGENIARCLTGNQEYHPDSEIPHQDCACGFWAYWTLQVHDGGFGQLPVCGVVEGYGATVIGERGFRAAKARIVALHLPFTIQPAGDSDPDPLGLGLPPSPGRGNGSPASPHNPGGTVYGPGNPWYRHPKFTGRVVGVPGHRDQPDPILDGLARTEPPPGLDKPSAAERQSNRDRADAWLAVMGDRLATMYPSAKIFETRAAMEAEFPPDLSYVPGSSREQCPHCSQWYQRKQNHPAGCGSRRS